MTFAYLIGPHTKHAYEPETKKELIKEIDALAEKGRDATPAEVRFTTYTLRYNRDAWVKVDGLEKHWERTDVKGKLGANEFTIDTKNVSALTLSLPPGKGGFAPFNTTIDGTKIQVLHNGNDNGAWARPFPEGGRQVEARQFDR